MCCKWKPGQARHIAYRRLESSSSSLVSIHADQNIIYHSLSTSLPTRQIIGFNDEIIDATFLSSPSSSSSSHSHLALAANASSVRIYSTSTFDARLLTGHKDMVLCLDKSPDHSMLVSGAKDQTARIWAPDSTGHWRCVAICEGHAESVGAVSFSKKIDEKTGRPKFLVTASQDRTIKLWDLSKLDLEAEEPFKPRSLATLRAHEKDINSLDISPNDRFLASGSQDKLVKIFEIDYTPSSSGATGALRLLGSCKGHRRGVWTVKFSRNDKIVASGAADKSVRLWSLDDLTCLKVSSGIVGERPELTEDVRGAHKLGPPRRLPQCWPTARNILV
jgi:U3 small nucleolar RNA-associated protein 13